MYQTVQTYIYSEPWSSLDIVDDYDDDNGEIIIASANDREMVEFFIEELGRKVAGQTSILEKLLPSLTCRTVHRGWSFGRGLAMGASSLALLWESLVNTYCQTPECERSIKVLRGFLNASVTHNSVLVNAFLDAALIDPVLGKVFPELQTSVEIGEREAKRLEASVKLGLAPAWIYQNLGHGHVVDHISSESLRRILNGVASLPEGLDYAIEIFNMRLYSTASDKTPIDDEIISCGQELLLKYNFEVGHFDNKEYRLAKIIDACFMGEKGALATVMLCQKLSAVMSGYRVFLLERSRLLKSLFLAQPDIVLNQLVGDSDGSSLSFVLDEDTNEKNPFRYVPLDQLMAWAKLNPVIRCKNLASVIPLFEVDNQSGCIKWSDIATRLLNLSPNRVLVLEHFRKRFRPSAWSGSLADILESRRILIRTLFSYDDTEVVMWAHQQDMELAQEVERERVRDRQADESFE